MPPEMNEYLSMETTCHTKLDASQKSHVCYHYINILAGKS